MPKKSGQQISRAVIAVGALVVIGVVVLLATRKSSSTDDKAKALAEAQAKAKALAEAQAKALAEAQAKMIAINNAVYEEIKDNFPKCQDTVIRTAALCMSTVLVNSLGLEQVYTESLGDDFVSIVNKLSDPQVAEFKQCSPNSC